ncbi:hypothetical protein [Cohnella sp.]|uniref:hypothetical protein n=1 Tax=Cohnella sp. TaxID=1883426 RepID=UPI00356B032C
MTVTEEDGFTLITYREDKRPLKLALYVIDSFEREMTLNSVIEFIEREANAPSHIANMEPAKFWALVERISTLFCRAFSPTLNWGVTKPEIRGAVYFVINEGMRAGAWPDDYTMTQSTFVQYSEVGCDE